MTAKLLDVDPSLARTAGAELEATAQSLAQQMGERVIRDTVDLEHAVADRAALGVAIQRVEAFFEPLKSMAHKLHAALCDRERVILAPLKLVDLKRRTEISDFKAQCDRERAERERAAAEQQRREDQARAAAEAAALETSGYHELAEAVVDEAIAQPLPVVALPDVTKAVEGLRFRRAWKWRYVGGPKDVAATPASVIARSLAIIPREFLTLDATKVGQYARAMKTAGKIPGIEIYSIDEPTR